MDPNQIQDMPPPTKKRRLLESSNFSSSVAPFQPNYNTQDMPENTLNTLRHKLVENRRLSPNSPNQESDDVSYLSDKSEDFQDFNVDEGEDYIIEQISDNENNQTLQNQQIFKNSFQDFSKNDSNFDNNDNQATINEEYITGADVDVLNMENQEDYVDEVLEDDSNSEDERNFFTDDNFFGFPFSSFLEKKKLSFSNLFEWQREVLLNKEWVQKRKNFLFSCSTSAGKTMIAEILLLKSLYLLKKKSILILPYVAVAEEKQRSLESTVNFLNTQQIVTENDEIQNVSISAAVEGYHAKSGSFPVPQGQILCVCTIEKCCALIHSLMEEKRMHEIDLVVVDEMHLLGEGYRGVILETLISKIVAYNETLKQNDKYDDSQRIQLIGMSATFPNISQAATWLNADCYISDFRPVPLHEFIVFDNSIYDSKTKSKIRDIIPTQQDPISALIQEIIPQHSVLVFCPTKSQTEQTAISLCSILPISLKDHKKPEKLEMLSYLKENCHLSPKNCALFQTIPFGVAYHHSLLTTQEKALIELYFTQQVIHTICCTTTLAAGINLPVRRVIFKSSKIGKETIKKQNYLQGAGRAGRKGLDDFGESFLVLQNIVVKKNVKEPFSSNSEMKEIYKSLFEDPIPNIVSQMNISQFSRFILEGIALRFCGNEKQATEFTKTTYFYQNVCETKKEEDVEKWMTELVKLVFQVLENKKMIQRESNVKLIDSNLVVTESIDSSSKPIDSNLVVTKAIDWNVKAIDSNLVVTNPIDSNVKSIDSNLVVTKAIDWNVKAIDSNLDVSISTIGFSTFRTFFSLSESQFFVDLLKSVSEKGIILQDDLHLCYLVIPFPSSSSNSNLIPTNWEKLFENVVTSPKAPVTTKRIMSNIQFPNELLFEMAKNPQKMKISKSNSKKKRNFVVIDELQRFFGTQFFGTSDQFFDSSNSETSEIIAQRFQNALILNDLINEVPIAQICEIHGIKINSRGMIQQFCNSVIQNSFSLLNFCHSLQKEEYDSLYSILKKFHKRVMFGCKTDLVNLMKIEAMPNVEIARKLKTEFKFEKISQIFEFFSEIFSDDEDEVTMNKEKWEKYEKKLLEIGIKKQDAEKLYLGAKNLMMKKYFKMKRKIVSQIPQILRNGM